MTATKLATQAEINEIQKEGRVNKTREKPEWQTMKNRPGKNK